MEIKLLPHQRDFVESPAEEVLFSGSYGSGKSLSLCAKIVFLLTRYPKNRGFLCRKTLQSLKASTLRTLLEGDGGQPAILPSYMVKNWNKQDRVLTLFNDSTLHYGQIDENQIKSMNLGFVAIDEATEFLEEEFNALVGRLRLGGVPVRQIFAATNPSGPNHWLYRRFFTDKSENT